MTQPRNNETFVCMKNGSNRSHFLLCRKYRPDISGITRKSAAKNLIGEADFLMGIFPFVSSVLGAGCVFSCSVSKAAQNANKGRFFTFFLPPLSNHSARHRLPLLGYPLSGKSTRQLSNYKRKKYWLYKLSIYFSDARFHMLFGFPPANGQESASLVCPHCRP